MPAALLETRGAMPKGAGDPDAMQEAMSPTIHVVKAASPKAEKEKEKDKEKWRSTRYENAEVPPWMDADGVTPIWSPFRVFLAKIVMSQLFERFMGLVIVFNLGIIWYETDMEARCYPAYDKGLIGDCPTAGGNILWVLVVNRILLGIYTLELIARLYVERRTYFKTFWNKLDFFVVLSGWFGEIFQGMINVAFLRIFRVSRLSRVVRIILAIKELYMLVMGMVSAMKAIFWGALMICFLLAFFSILLVEFVHPVNSKLNYGDCERCPRAYASVLGSSMTLFQHIVAGDSWGTTSIPAMEGDSTPISGLLLGTVLVVISLGFMNLILAVIVASAEEGRENDIKKRLSDAAKEKEAQAQQLRAICVQVDKDGSGTLSLTEMYNAYESNESFRTMFQMMDIRREDIKNIYSMLDANDNGEVDYDEFCENVYRLKTDDVRKLVTEAKFLANETNNMVRKNFNKIESHDKILQKHSELLLSINEKLNRLSGTAAAPGAAKSADLCTQPISAVPVFEDKHTDRAPGATLHGTTTSGRDLNGIGSGDNSFREALMSIAQISTWLHDGVARRSDDAAVALLQHAEVLAAAAAQPPPCEQQPALARLRELKETIAGASVRPDATRDRLDRLPGPAIFGPSPDFAAGVRDQQKMQSSWRKHSPAPLVVDKGCLGTTSGDVFGQCGLRSSEG